MLKELINRAKGQVRIRVESAFPERVLNLCGARQLSFWDLEWESLTAFTCRLSRRDWHTLRRAVHGIDCTLTVVGREGAPYFLFRFRNRTALLVGLVSCGLGLFLGSFFIWDFQIEGNENVPDEAILRALEKNGVKFGVFGLSLDNEYIRNHVLLDLPELSWIAVNVSGCRANVQVRERVPMPEQLDRDTPTNVVARRAGLVLKLYALDGVNCVVPGSTVEEGQILISGIEDTETFGARLLAGMGQVEARTWYTLTAPLELTVQKKIYTGETSSRISLVFGTHRLNCLGGVHQDGAYDKTSRRYPLSLLGLPLPVTVVAETYRFYETAEEELTQTEAEERVGNVLEDYLYTLVEPYGTVESTLCSSRKRGDVLWVTLRAECREQIGKTVPIYHTLS